MTSKVQRQTLIVRLVGDHEVTSQPDLIDLLAAEGIDATQATFRNAGIRHILANEAADTAASKATDGFSKLVRELRGAQKADGQVFELQKRAFRRLAAIEHHIRDKMGTRNGR